MKQNKNGSPVLNDWKNKIKHAFSVEPDQMNLDEYIPLLDKIAGFITKRRLEIPTILTLQSLLPLNFIGSQALIVIQPFLDSFFIQSDYDKLVEILERREGIQLLIQRIESMSKRNK